MTGSQQVFLQLKQTTSGIEQALAIRADASAFRQFPHKSTKLSMFEGLMAFFIRLEHYVLLTLDNDYA